MDEIYVVTNPELGWDDIVGVFSNEEYVYSKYGNRPYVIHSESINNSIYVKPSSADLTKYGRTEYNYKAIECKNVRCKGDFKCDADGELIYNLIDPFEGVFTIEFGGKEQSHIVENLSLVADLFCEFTKIDKENIRIYSDGSTSYFLGTTVGFADNAHLYKFMENKGVDLYY